MEDERGTNSQMMTMLLMICNEKELLLIICVDCMSIFLSFHYLHISSVNIWTFGSWTSWKSTRMKGRWKVKAKQSHEDKLRTLIQHLSLPLDFIWFLSCHCRSFEEVLNENIRAFTMSLCGIVSVILCCLSQCCYFLLYLIWVNFL